MQALALGFIRRASLDRYHVILRRPEGGVVGKDGSLMNSIQADALQTYRVSAKRFERSPFHDCYANEQTVLSVYAGRFIRRSRTPCTNRGR